MKKRITIKDISERTKLSYGTIHRALTGKKGVGDEMRAFVLKVSDEMGYVPNHVASSLKRKPLHIVVSFPELTKENSYFYSFVWEGFQECIEQYMDFNVTVTKVPYSRKKNSQRDELLSVLNEYEGEIHGLLTQGNIGEQGEKAIMTYETSGIPIVFACDDIPSINRICCVQADHYMTGKMVAELLSSQISEGSAIIIGSDDSNVPSHSLTLNGFLDFIKSENLNFDVIKVHGYEKESETFLKTKELLLKNKSIKALYSVNARDTVAMCNAVIEANVSNGIRTIGSDIFNESIQFMKQGVLKNIIYKNPKEQSFKATKILLDYLIKNEEPKQDVMYVDTSIVFKSNLPLYEFEI